MVAIAKRLAAIVMRSCRRAKPQSSYYRELKPAEVVMAAVSLPAIR
jgi:hypothetical protein